jgi:hypothetical protein
MGRGMKRHSKVVWPGFSNTPVTRHAVKVGRNEPCPCGSKKKYKDCHEKDGSIWLEKLARLEDKKRMKEQGAPWWRRWFS